MKGEEIRKLVSISRSNYVNFPRSFLKKSGIVRVAMELDSSRKKVTLYKL